MKQNVVDYGCFLQVVELLACLSELELRCVGQMAQKERRPKPPFFISQQRGLELTSHRKFSGGL